MRKNPHSVVLEAPDGSGTEIALWVTGSAVLHNETGATHLEALIEAEGAWVDLGGTSEEFDEAVGYLDSIR